MNKIGKSVELISLTYCLNDALEDNCIQSEELMQKREGAQQCMARASFCFGARAT